MKFYKGYNSLKNKVIKYVNYNDISCKYVGWCGMCGDIDRVKIDGKNRYFNIYNNEEVPTYKGY